MKTNKKKPPMESFSVGDKIVDFGQVYRIHKIGERKNEEGKKEKIIYFKPYYKTEKNRTLVYSIPVKNLDRTHIRKPIPKKRLNKLLKKLSEKEKTSKPVDTNQAKEELRLNKLVATAKILKRLFLDKQNKETKFNQTQQNLFDLSLKRLVEEVAFVHRLTIAEAKNKILQALKKGTED